MGLLARVLSLLGGLALRAALLFAALFGIHLLLWRALPELQETVAAIEREPAVAQQLEEVRKVLETEAGSVEQLERRLDSLGRARLQQVKSELETWRVHLEELDDERRRLLSQLDSMRRQRDDYCGSLNPLKRWMCNEIDERLSDLTTRLQPLLQELQDRADAGKGALERSQADLEVLQEPNLSTEEKLRRLGDDDGSTLALQLGAARERLVEATAGAAALRRELDTIRARKDSRSGWLLREWNAVRVELLIIVGVVLVLPYAQRVVSYFVLMPLLSRVARPLRLAERSDGSIACSAALRSLTLGLGAGEQVQVRAEYARPVQGTTSSRVLYDWRAPFISYAAGLRLLTRVDGDTRGAQLTLAAPDDPNAYLMRLDLDQHPGVILHPKHVVGVVGQPQLTTHWRLFSLHAWLTWQLRFIAFQGTGAVIVEGHGDLVATRPGARPTKIEQQLVVGFDTRLEYRTARTEAFLPYLFGKTPLVDDVFNGEGPMLWQKSITPASRNPVARAFDVLFSAIGKLLGF